MKAVWAVLAVVVVVGLWWLPNPDHHHGSSDEPLLCHVGGTMTPVFQELVRRFTARNEAEITINTAGSGELMATIEMRGSGDLYVCHDPYMDTIFERGLAIDAWYLAELVPVLIVAKGNPLAIQGLPDLQRDEVRVHLTDREYSTLGHMLPIIFAKAAIDVDELIARKRISTHRSGSHVANLVALGTADAALVWQAVAHLRRDDLDIIPITDQLPIPTVDVITSATGRDYDVAPVKVTLISLAGSRRPRLAAAFSEFVRSAEGRAVLTDFGYHLGPEAGRQEFAGGIRLARPRVTPSATSADARSLNP